MSILGEALPPPLIPALVFILSALTAFATGFSWGVMGIVMPLVVPLTWAVMAANGIAGDPAHMHIFYSAITAVLAGAVWGDHCSPISDTTILSSSSSLGTECNHIDHVRTQPPYALAVGLVGLFAGTLLAAYLYPWWVGMLVRLAMLTAVPPWQAGRRGRAGCAPAGTPRRGPMRQGGSGKIAAGCEEPVRERVASFEWFHLA